MAFWVGRGPERACGRVLWLGAEWSSEGSLGWKLKALLRVYFQGSGCLEAFQGGKG